MFYLINHCTQNNRITNCSGLNHGNSWYIYRVEINRFSVMMEYT